VKKSLLAGIVRPLSNNMLIRGDGEYNVIEK